ncbi:MAG TPA: hypothetical protein VN901_25985, partial [Candidatus Acidoferrales bacterium]|nr:hypothetical protein [Candidatus Acidoferrales bacterium]
MKLRHTSQVVHFDSSDAEPESINGSGVAEQTRSPLAKFPRRPRILSETVVPIGKVCDQSAI